MSAVFVCRPVFRGFLHCKVRRAA